MSLRMALALRDYVRRQEGARKFLLMEAVDENLAASLEALA